MGVRNHIDSKGFWTEDVGSDDNTIVVNGSISGQRMSIIDVTSDLSLGSETRSASVILVDASTDRVTLTLPDISGIEGYGLTIKKTDITVNEVVLRGTGVQLIDGSTSQTITEPYTSVTLVSSNNDWWII